MVTRFVTDLGEAIGSALTIGLIALFVSAFFPQQLNRMEATIRQKPAASGAVGLLTGVASVSLGSIILLVSSILLFVCIGIFGFPVLLGLMLVTFAAAALSE